MPMTRMSEMGLIAAVVLLIAPCAALARNHTSARPPHANRGGIAQSSGPSLNHRNKGIHTGSTALGSGDTKPLSSPNADAAVQAENELLEAEEHLPWLLAGTDKGSRRVEPETLLSSRKGSPNFS